MKILQINAFCGYGSTGRIAVEIATSLPPEDECYIAYGYFDTDYPQTYKLLNDTGLNNYKVRLLRNRLTGRTGYVNTKGTYRFLEWIDTYNPDIIHIHNLHDDYINIKILFDYLKKRQYPVVWTFHDCWPFTGRCAYFEYNKCLKWIDGCYSCKFKKVFPITYFFDCSERDWKYKKVLFNGLDNLTIVTPSKWLSNYVAKSFLSPNRVVVINNGVNIEQFKRTDFKTLISRYKLDNIIVVLGVASSWSFRKGLNYFFDLAKLLDKRYRIVLIGLNSKQLKSLPDNIIGLTRTNSVEELAQWYSLASVYVNPTLEDNYPTTNIEAQSCGTPVVTFATGGSPETIKNGIITEEKNAQSIKTAIESILSNNSVKSVDRKLLSKDYSSKKYYELYQSIISK